MPCRHRAWEDVVLYTGETVGKICVSCLIDLPLEYEGDIAAIQMMTGEVVAYIPMV